MLRSEVKSYYEFYDLVEIIDEKIMQISIKQKNNIETIIDKIKLT